MLDFCVELLQEYATHLQMYDSVKYGFLLVAVTSAQAVNNVFRDSGRMLDLPQRSLLMCSYLRFHIAFVRAGGGAIPKSHLMVHMIQNTALHGNPRFYWSFRNESLNGVVTKIARGAHRLTFMITVLNKFKWLHDLEVSSYMF